MGLCAGSAKTPGGVLSLPGSSGSSRLIGFRWRQGWSLSGGGRVGRSRGRWLQPTPPCCRLCSGNRRSWAFTGRWKPNLLSMSRAGWSGWLAQQPARPRRIGCGNVPRMVLSERREADRCGARRRLSGVEKFSAASRDHVLGRVFQSGLRRNEGLSRIDQKESERLDPRCADRFDRGDRRVAAISFLYSSEPELVFALCSRSSAVLDMGRMASGSDKSDGMARTNQLLDLSLSPRSGDAAGVLGGTGREHSSARVADSLLLDPNASAYDSGQRGGLLCSRAAGHRFRETTGWGPCD